MWRYGDDVGVASRQIRSAKMLAEIFMLQLEATLRTNKEDTTFAPKFVPFDRTTVPGIKRPGTSAPLGRVITE
jgi:hypothetical protein